MQFPDNEATRSTEELMEDLTSGNSYSTEKYNAAYSAVHALITEMLENEQRTAIRELK